MLLNRMQLNFLSCISRVLVIILQLAYGGNHIGILIVDLT